MHALGQHFLARAAFAAHQHRGVHCRVAPCQLAQLVHGGRGAGQVVQAVAHPRRPRAAARAQVAVDPVDGIGILQGEHGAGSAGLGHDGNTVDHHHFVAELVDGLQFLATALHHAVQGQRRRQRLQLAAQRGGRRGTEETFHGRVIGLDAPFRVDRGHAFVEVGQDGIDVVAPGGLDTAQAGRFDRILQRAPHRIARVQEHADQADPVGQVGHHAGPYHHLDAFLLEGLHAGRGIVLGQVGVGRNRQREGPHELVHLRIDRGMGHQRHLRRDAPGRGQRAHHIEPGHLDQHYRHVHVLAQIGAVGATRDHGIEPALAGFAGDGAGGSRIALAHDAEFGLGRIAGDQVGESARQAADTDRPDARAGGIDSDRRIEGRWKAERHGSEKNGAEAWGRLILPLCAPAACISILKYVISLLKCNI